MAASSSRSYRGRLRSFGVVCVLGLVAVSAAPSIAQVPASDPDTAQVVGLFEQSCLRFAGNAVELRNWITAHHLPRVPAIQAAPFLGGVAGGLGEVFGASTDSGNHAVVSYDNGTCQVIAMSGDMLAVQQSLLAPLGRLGVAVTPILGRAKPDGSSSQQIYRASLGPKHWMLSITAHPHADAPSVAPELHLMATVE